VLIMVAGLSALLLSLAVAVLASTKALNEPSLIVLAEAQNRITLGSALTYLQETSRLGWGTNPGDHAYGWTDVRDGEIGPRGPRDASGTINRLGWSPGGNFPAPGGVLRGDLYAWRLPPYAISQEVAPNAFKLTDADAAQAAWAPIVGAEPVIREWNDGSPKRTDSARPFWQRAVADTKTNGTGGYVTQPVMGTWNEFAAGDQRPQAESVGRTWFRIYRERSTDCDGNGVPWYDTVPFAGSGTFIVTVGAGATRGFRFWDASTDYLNGRTSIPAGISAHSSPIDPVTASASGLFFDEGVFKAMRQGERIAWYRVQWTASTSSGLDPLAVVAVERGLSTQNRFHGIMTQTEQTNDFNILPHHGGAIRWIQRLEKEPPVW